MLTNHVLSESHWSTVNIKWKMKANITWVHLVHPSISTYCTNFLGCESLPKYYCEVGKVSKQTVQLERRMQKFWRPQLHRKERKHKGKINLKKIPRISVTAKMCSEFPQNYSLLIPVFNLEKKAISWIPSGFHLLFYANTRERLRTIYYSHAFFWQILNNILSFPHEKTPVLKIKRG